MKEYEYEMSDEFEDEARLELFGREATEENGVTVITDDLPDGIKGVVGINVGWDKTALILANNGAVQCELFDYQRNLRRDISGDSSLLSKERLETYDSVSLSSEGTTRIQTDLEDLIEASKIASSVAKAGAYAELGKFSINSSEVEIGFVKEAFAFDSDSGLEDKYVSIPLGSTDQFKTAVKHLEKAAKE